MSISNEQIVLSLIAYYKTRGIDMASLLSDPVFHQLKLEEKIQAIKNHANTIVSHSVAPSHMDKNMRAGIIGDTIVGGLGGLAAGATAGKLARNAILAKIPDFAGVPYGHRPFSIGATATTMLAAGTLGAIIGGAASYIKNTESKIQRANLLDHLQAVVDNPTDMNAVGVLSSHHNPNRSNPILNKLTGYLADKMKDSAENSYSTLPNNWVQSYNRYGPEPTEPKQ